ncbi:hypothetical protein O6H91_01G043900 [Diphasiastrum complanatum]|uniref:Uncharacterized protein n=1 Tax=Diphasiastrum complanatum TaxID=34168 RepID=A0ACC2EQH7_DIPCM|nr:hypothetical protein O6H91_01G043900 [Diphasiastrum complanatum]
MPKARSEAWAHVLILGEAGKSSGGSGMKKVQCKFRDHVFQGGLQRVVSHLLGSSEKGVKPCTKTPLNVKQSLQLESQRIDSVEEVEEGTADAQTFVEGGGPSKRGREAISGSQKQLQESWSVK